MPHATCSELYGPCPHSGEGYGARSLHHTMGAGRGGEGCFCRDQREKRLADLCVRSNSKPSPGLASGIASRTVRFLPHGITGCVCLHMRGRTTGRGHIHLTAFIHDSGKAAWISGRGAVVRRPVLDLYHGIRITLNINSSGTKHHLKPHAETSRARDTHTAYPYTSFCRFPRHRALKHASYPGLSTCGLR